MVDRLRLDGRVAIVTGGAGGIGSATAALMTARGATVVVADIALERAVQVAATLPRASACRLDLADEASVRAMIESVVRQHGRLDILHNNAAALDPALAQLDGDVERMRTDVWDLIFGVNLRGTMIACREALPHLKATGNGVIVNTVSNLGLQGHMIQAAYSATKAALIQLTRSIAASHARQGVRSNAVAPGMTSTPALLAAFPEALRQVVEAETLRDRLGEPADIAEAVAFLASDAASNITGHVLVSDGGLSSHVPGLDGFRKFFGEPA